MNNIITDNNVTLSGGGIWCEGSSPYLINNLFYDNSATAQGGAVFVEYSGSPVLINNTIVGNTAGKQGAGLALYGSAGSVVNTILWNNSAPAYPEAYLVAATTTFASSVVKGGIAGTEILDTDPLFMDEGAGDCHLSWTSPCINRGSNAEAPDADLEGEARPCMGTCDMGCYEFTGTHTLSADAFVLSQPLGGTMHLSLQAGAAHAGQWYCVFGSKSGTVPGLPLPGGLAVLPVNWDGFTDLVIAWLNTPAFTAFLSQLDGAGAASATIQIQPGHIPLAWADKTLRFAFTVDGFALASNPVEAHIDP